MLLILLLLLLLLLLFGRVHCLESRSFFDNSRTRSRGKSRDMPSQRMRGSPHVFRVRKLLFRKPCSSRLDRPFFHLHLEARHRHPLPHLPIYHPSCSARESVRAEESGRSAKSARGGSTHGSTLEGLVNKSARPARKTCGGKPFGWNSP